MLFVVASLSEQRGRRDTRGRSDDGERNGSKGREERVEWGVVRQKRMCCRRCLFGWMKEEDGLAVLIVGANSCQRMWQLVENGQWNGSIAGQKL